ncbi:MAG TPA: hypothetical protein VG273_27275 [Bryobacteraceae bacterium]|nr:hypothetical protein [Bryobacteraceae bacterium]
MKLYTQIGLISLLAGAVVGLTSCSTNSTAGAQTPGNDPAAANVAPAQPAQTSPASYVADQTPPPPNGGAGYYPPPPNGQAAGAYTGDYYDPDTENDQQYAQDQYAFDEQPVVTDQPPPPLPDYSQPPAPGDDYIWTPGYWSWSSDGYYWTPGAWVLAPWVGALWTPPYWGFYGGHYRYHHGYWAPHVGYYGGINYGFGYTGRGYEGGYWNNGSFDYNTAVNNVNPRVAHHVYSRSVANFTPHNHVAYEGGRGGLNVRPTPAETAVLHEQRTPAVAAQLQHTRQAASNRQQFAARNQGRPAQLAATAPLATNYRAPAPRPEPSQVRSLPEGGARTLPQRAGQERPIQERAGQPPQQRQQPPAAPAARAMPQPNRNQPAVNARGQEARPSPFSPPSGQPAQHARQMPENRPAPAARSMPEPRPAPAARPMPEARPAPAARAMPENRPAPVARPAPAARAMPEARPAAPAPPQARPAPGTRAMPEPQHGNPGGNPGRGPEERHEPGR